MFLSVLTSDQRQVQFEILGVLLSYLREILFTKSIKPVLTGDGKLLEYLRKDSAIDTGTLISWGVGSGPSTHRDGNFHLGVATRTKN